MSDFRKLTDDFYVSPQITSADIKDAKALGISLIVSNRPDGEAEDQPEAKDIEDAARAAGMNYVAIPVSHAGFSIPQVEALQRSLKEAEGKVLAFCRSGTRSTLLWALARAAQGDDFDDISVAAHAGGYSLAPVQAMMDMLATNQQG